MYRKPGERPQYPPDPPTKRPQRPKPRFDGPTVFQTKLQEKRRVQYPGWRPSIRWPRVTMVEIFIGLVFLLIIWGFAYEVYNPCVRFGPEKTYFDTVSCGDNCWMVVPRTYRECLEREKK